MSAAIPGFTSSDRHPPRVRRRLSGHRLDRSWGRKTGPTPGPGTRCVLSGAGRHPARPPTPGAKHRSLGRGTPPNAPPQQVGGCGGWGPRPTPRTRLPGPKASVSQRVAGTRGHGGLPPAFPPRVPGRAQSTLLVSLCELLDQLFVAIGAVRDHQLVSDHALFSIRGLRLHAISRSRLHPPPPSPRHGEAKVVMCTCRATCSPSTPTPRKPALMFGDLI